MLISLQPSPNVPKSDWNLFQVATWTSMCLLKHWWAIVKSWGKICHSGRWSARSKAYDWYPSTMCVCFDLTSEGLWFCVWCGCVADIFPSVLSYTSLANTFHVCVFRLPFHSIIFYLPQLVLFPPTKNQRFLLCSRTLLHRLCLYLLL